MNNSNSQSQIEIPNYQITETLYTGSRTTVHRGIRTIDQLPVVIKLLKNPYPSFQELIQFRNQYTIAKNLNSPLIIKTYSLEAYSNSYALIMEDFGGISLKQWGLESQKPSLREFLQIAITLCDALELLYQERIIHKDIKPSNILINPQSQQIKLIDFSIASRLPRETQTLINPNILEGTLAYISPEQTGRMNRGIDYRTDFYSLGITFYELLSGELPFQSKDLIELVHCHIAKMPSELSKRQEAKGNREEREKRGEIPQVLSDIVMKLMAKNAEDRYQSALGLKHDLENCLTQLQKNGQIQPFPIGKRDLCERFLIPEKLYGREKEVQQLLDSFERISNPPESNEERKAEMILVAGFSGVGKTAVVNEIHKPIVRQRGYFIKGKFDQFNRNIPFSGFVQALRDLMEQLLSETDHQLENWKTQILSALGKNGQVIIEVIPELQQIIGQQPRVPQLSGSAAENRFNLLFSKFIQVFSTAKHPLVIFLDDLQWADSASLKLIELLMSETCHYLLLIGAYRDHEVSTVHPLMLTLAEINQKRKKAIETITLEPLSLSHLNQLIAETLNCSLKLAEPLSELLHQKTKGNPFFTTVFLKVLYEEGVISFNRELRYWQCELTAVKMLALTGDVVEFMAMQIEKLAPETQKVLKLAACIGNRFDLTTLATVSQDSFTETAVELWPALQEGLVLPTSKIYNFFTAANELNIEAESETLDLSYTFLHDRVQQAAYSLIPEEEKQKTHLQIGYLLLRHEKEVQDQKIFEIVNQLNIGRELITDYSAKEELATLNLMAGKKAKNSTAYSAAVQYLTIARELLTHEIWQIKYPLALDIYTEATEVAYLNGNFEEMEQLATLVLAQAHTLLDQVKIYEIKIIANILQTKLLEAIEIGREILKPLGTELPEQPTEAYIGEKMAEIVQNLQGKSIEELIELPAMTDGYRLGAMQILSSLWPAAYIGSPGMLPPMVFEMVNLSLKYGNSPMSAVGYSIHGLMLCGVFGDLNSGYQFGEVALKLVDQLNAREFKAKVLTVFATFIQHWKTHLSQDIPIFKEGAAIGLEIGDLEFTGYSTINSCLYSFLLGKNLAELNLEIPTALEMLTVINQDVAQSWVKVYWQTALNLLEGAKKPTKLKGRIYNEKEMLPVHQKNNDFPAICHFSICKLILSYLFEDYPEALKNAGEGEKYLGGLTGMAHIPTFYFYDALTRLALCKHHLNSTEKENLWQPVETHLEKMRNWANYAPMNYLHKLELMEAEKHRVLGQRYEAMEIYDRAITGAKENKYVQEEALANELTAKFYLDWGKDKIAAGYMQEAYYCYTRWGAKAKAHHLQTHYPQLLQPILHQQRLNLNPSETLIFPVTSSTQTSSNSVSDILDLNSVLKAAQVISSSLELETLIASLTRIILENSGAKKAALILPQNKTWEVKAITLIHQDEIQTSLESQLLEHCAALPGNIIHYVKNTKKTIVIDNCQTEIPGLMGEYLLKHQPQSVLCTPILNQGNVMGILYLENQLISGVFTCERLSVIHLLSCQAAISLENAQLYRQAQQALKDLQQAQLQIVQSEKMSALGNLVSGVAHEMNNPLGFIFSSIKQAQPTLKEMIEHLKLYQDNFPANEAILNHALEIDLNYNLEDLPKVIETMLVACERLKNISTSLRTFSRADQDHKIFFNLHEGIDSTLLILKHRLKANQFRSGIEVVKNYGEIPLIECFPGQLNQVFMNLLANSIDALDECSQEGNFKSKNSQPQKIWIGTERSKDGESVEIRIADNGMGIPEEMKEKIFEHLFTTKEVGKGTGLGLAIVRQIILEKHGGSIQVNSQPQEGSEFLITLPIKAQRFS